MTLTDSRYQRKSPRIVASPLPSSGTAGCSASLPTSVAEKRLVRRDLESIHVPVAYISGDPRDIAFKNAEADFDYLTKIPAFRAYERGVGHGGTYREPNGGEFSGIAVAWLNWQLKGDQRAALMFRGSDCGLCVNPKWVVRTKNLN